MCKTTRSQHLIWLQTKTTYNRLALLYRFTLIETTVRKLYLIYIKEKVEFQIFDEPVNGIFQQQSSSASLNVINNTRGLGGRPEILAFGRRRYGLLGSGHRQRRRYQYRRPPASPADQERRRPGHHREQRSQAEVLHRAPPSLFIVTGFPIRCYRAHGSSAADR